MSSHVNTKLILDCYNAFNQRDFKKIQNLVSEKATFALIPFKQNFQGKTQLVAAFELWVTAFPDMTILITHLMVTEEGGVAEFMFQGTHRGVLNMPTGKIDPTGKQFEIEGCEVFKIEDGKLVSVRSYFDSGELFRQLGQKTFPQAA